MRTNLRRRRSSIDVRRCGGRSGSRRWRLAAVPPRRARRDGRGLGRRWPAVGPAVPCSPTLARSTLSRRARRDGGVGRRCPPVGPAVRCSPRELHVCLASTAEGPRMPSLVRAASPRHRRGGVASGTVAAVQRRARRRGFCFVSAAVYAPALAAAAARGRARPRRRREASVSPGRSVVASILSTARRPAGRVSSPRRRCVDPLRLVTTA